MVSERVNDAISLAETGFFVFPVIVDGKAPRHKGWQTQATRDKEQIKKLWEQDYNIGVLAHRFADQKMVVIDLDLDSKNGKDGLRAFADLCVANEQPYPITLTVNTPRGGQHLYFLTSKTFKNSASKLLKGIDVRGEGGLVVAPGSKIKGNGYTIAKLVEPAPLPSWLENLIFSNETEVTAPTAPAKEGVIFNRPANILRAVEFLKTAPPAIENSGGDSHTFAVACKIKDLGVSEAKTLDLMLEHFNEKCVPPWEINDLKTKIRNAFSFGSNEPGSETPDAQFDPVTQTDAASDREKCPAYIEEMNAGYFIVNENGKAMIYSRDRDPLLKRMRITRYSFQDFKNLQLANYYAYQVENENGEFKNVRKNKAVEWLKHPKRRQYLGGVVFDPSNEASPNQFNLWQGWNVVPEQGDWSLIRRHMLEVICSGNESHFEYLRNWLANMIQNPGQPGDVAIVIRGGKGVGKTLFGELILKLAGQHGLNLTQASQIVGRFNSHLRDAVFILLNEAFFAPDRQHEAALKGLVTDKFLSIEEKHRSVEMVKNVTHLMFTSNDDWIVPATADERRYFVLDASNRYARNQKYFSALAAQADSGGLAAMLYDLLRIDLTGLDLKNPPWSAALVDQIIHSLKGPEAWLFSVLKEAQLGGADWSATGLSVSKDEAYRLFQNFSKETLREYRPATKGIWGKAVLSALGGGAVRFTRPHCEPRQLAFADLTMCRKRFEDRFKLAGHKWDSEDVELTNEDADETQIDIFS